jgi:diguanylate cyclase (GGDEF)-like protein
VRRWWWSAGLAGQAMLAAGYVLLVLREVGSAEARSIFSCLFMLEAALFAAGSAVVAGRKAVDRRGRLAWRLLGAGCLLWGVTQLWWTVLEVVRIDAPVLLGLAGLGYTALVLLALPALRLLVARSPRTTAAPTRSLPLVLDVLTLTGAVVVLGWTLALERVLQQGVVVPLLFAAGDIAVAVVVLSLLAWHVGGIRRPLQLAAAGLVLVAAADLTYVGQAVLGRYVTGTVLDTGWIVGFLLIAAGARASWARQAERPLSLAGKRLQLLLPYIPVALAVAVAGHDLTAHDDSDPVVLGLALGIVVLSVLRQGLTLTQNAELLDALALREVDLLRRALEDPLTGLGNRTLLLERLDTALRAPDGDRVALLFIDLDDFKLINDTHGHEAGDHVLVEIARRLTTLVHEGETVSRLGGDEFAVLLLGRSGEQVAAEVLAALREPVLVGVRRFLLAASVGVVCAEAADETAGTLLSHADIAMYTAKGAGKGRIAVVEGSDRAAAVRRTRVRELIAHPQPEDLRVLYQPVVDLRDGQIRGVEALVRWHHPEIGPVPPDEFIHLAEQAGSIGVIGSHVLRTALRDLAGWAAEFPGRRLGVGVNVSPLQLVDDRLLTTAVEELSRLGLDNDQLILEITEEALVGDIEQAARAVAALRGVGISVAIDDFGTGYSSFRYLDRFEADVLKIDRSFVAKMGASDRTRELVRSVAGLGRVLDLQTIAEGVETLGDLRLLREMGVELAQGFLFSRPVSKEQIGGLLATGGRFPLDLAPPQPRAGGLVRSARPRSG